MDKKVRLGGSTIIESIEDKFSLNQTAKQSSSR